MTPYYVCLGIAVLVGVARIIEWRRPWGKSCSLCLVGSY